MSARFRKTRRYTNVICCEVLSTWISKTGRYTNGLLLPEDPAFRAKPRPECSANFFLGRTHSFNLSFSFPRFVAWPLELGLGTHNPRFGVAPRVGVRDSQSTLCCVAPRVGVRDSQSTLFYLLLFLLLLVLLLFLLLHRGVIRCGTLTPFGECRAAQENGLVMDKAPKAAEYKCL